MAALRSSSTELLYPRGLQHDGGAPQLMQGCDALKSEGKSVE
jgi:hypothetical protein